jgi:hypothetical protein
MFWCLLLSSDWVAPLLGLVLAGPLGTSCFVVGGAVRGGGTAREQGAVSNKGITSTESYATWRVLRYNLP